LGEKSLQEEVVGKAMLEVQNDDEPCQTLHQESPKLQVVVGWRLRSWRSSPPHMASSIYTFTLKYVDV
jgi:hypothetical protein